MFNITEQVRNNQLILTIDLSENGRISRTGKSKLIASSEGNLPVDGNSEIKYGLNVYKPI